MKTLMLNILLVLRYLFCLLGAAALLWALSFPDAIIPPNPAMEEAEGITLYSLKPLIWVVPVLFMELASCCGPRRNLVWFSALFTVLVLALLAYPLLAAWRPEYVEPTFVYQGGMLTTGLWRFAAFTGISFAIRKMLLAYMFPAEDLQEQLEVGFVSATALNPATARTVKEIAAEEKAKRPNFRFQAGDQRNALRFKLIVQRMLLRSRLANTCIGIGALLLVLWCTCFPRPTDEEALQRDLRLMLQHRPAANGYPLATSAAVHAAARVMKHISDFESFAGMSPAEAEQWLGLDKLPEAARTWMRDSRPIELDATNSMHENRTRFLTVTDGRHFCVLYVRTNEADGSIIISEFQDSGWDAVADENRRRTGTDWGALYR